MRLLLQFVLSLLKHIHQRWQFRKKTGNRETQKFIIKQKGTANSSKSWSTQTDLITVEFEDINDAANTFKMRLGSSVISATILQSFPEIYLILATSTKFAADEQRQSLVFLLVSGNSGYPNFIQLMREMYASFHWSSHVIFFLCEFLLPSPRIENWIKEREKPGGSVEACE